MGLFDATPFVIAGVFIVAYIYLYISSRQYLKQGFSDRPTTWAEFFRSFWPDKTRNNVRRDASGNVLYANDASGGHILQYRDRPTRTTNVDINSAEKPYTTSQIMGVDDYEYSMVFQNESDREVSTDLRNKLMSQYPMDWSTQPPSSSQFQQGMREMFENKEEVIELDGARNPYTAVTDDSMKPPDTLSMEQEERKIIQTYQPKRVGDLTTYNVEDAMELIKRIYDKKGEIPQVIKKNDSVYEVIGTRKKDEKIVYEEMDGDAPATADPSSVAGENVTMVPQPAVDKNSALDPFYEPNHGGSSRTGRWTYRQWTPGLERMFAPTEAKADWH
jgi:hypothetical protein